jgi:hypothetical protein
MTPTLRFTASSPLPKATTIHSMSGVTTPEARISEMLTEGG